MTKSPARGRALGHQGTVLRVFFVVASGQDPGDRGRAAQACRARERAWVRTRQCGIDLAGQLVGVLHTNGEPVPELVVLLRQVTESNAPVKRIVPCGSVPPTLLRSAGTRTGHCRGQRSPSRSHAPPVSAGIAVDAADAQDLEILVKRVAIAVQADEAKTGFAMPRRTPASAFPRCDSAMMSVPVGRLSTSELVYGEVSPEPPDVVIDPASGLVERRHRARSCRSRSQSR